ncbi:hypothetical protein CW749_19675 [Vibrio sp. vnigr-6D03]|uniref:class I SAM-dependent methyltransferase n=1 Tax=Vibrio sp. vnigr-6D03 TaxID=2058088 RepID=UPI000C3471EB|nr:class I SAM-dependent methyltransferase [Vibrio sp. vnigr-6D03]PKF77759.1 hypothetical protein CW749_19675 [Vibrio sp. vnigr-6D03]
MYQNIEFDVDSVRDDSFYSPWGGHREIAYYLVETTRPKKIVELGTHWGVSFFSFLQSIKNNELETDIYAIDTWEGEEHAGKYGDEVFEHVKGCCHSFFANQKYHLVRKLFDNAACEFENESIDILHIDGLHTYDATKNDFEVWLPKLSEQGIVLFHDIASDVDYGSKDYWNEIKEKYAHFEIDHSWGLGILFPKGLEKYKILVENDFEKTLYLLKFKYLSQLKGIQLEKAEQLIKDKEILIRKTEELALERFEIMSRYEEEINELRYNNKFTRIKKLFKKN